MKEFRSAREAKDFFLLVAKADRISVVVAGRRAYILRFGEPTSLSANPLKPAKTILEYYAQ